MSRIVEYKMAYAEGGPSVSSERVQDLINDGWHPYGSPVVDREFIMQAMVIYEDDED